MKSHCAATRQSIDRHYEKPSCAPIVTSADKSGERRYEMSSRSWLWNTKPHLEQRDPVAVRQASAITDLHSNEIYGH
jgi:hypothetical protein